MAINRPTTKTIISTNGWGIPITDEVNRLTTWQLAQVPSAWTNLPLLNGWVNIGGSRPTTAVRKFGELVVLRVALMSGNIGGGISPFTIPAGYRPGYYLDAWARCGPTYAFLNIDTAGTAAIFPAASADNSGLYATVVYPVS
jgi:hypothetical protein